MYVFFLSFEKINNRTVFIFYISSNRIADFEENSIIYNQYLKRCHSLHFDFCWSSFCLVAIWMTRF